MHCLPQPAAMAGGRERAELLRRISAQRRAAGRRSADGRAPKEPYSCRDAAPATLRTSADVGGLAAQDLRHGRNAGVAKRVRGAIAQERDRRVQVAADPLAPAPGRRRDRVGDLNPDDGVVGRGATPSAPRLRIEAVAGEEIVEQHAGDCDRASAPTGRRVSSNMPSRGPRASSVYRAVGR